MTVVPGWSGQKMIDSCLGKIKQIKAIAKEYGIKDMFFEVDGGVNLDNISKVIRAGAHAAVSGKALYVAEDKNAFIKDFTSNYNIQEDYEFDEIWNKYFENKVPDYFCYHYISDWNIMEWNFSELKNLLKDLPNDKWLTDSYDREWVFEHITQSFMTFDADL